jgi:hypothetical protein
MMRSRNVPVPTISDICEARPFPPRTTVVVQSVCALGMVRLSPMPIAPHQ